MTLDAEDKAWIETTFKKIVVASPSAPAAIMPRLTIAQFACAVEHHPDTITRKIRTHDIPANLVFGERPKKISPKALELFGVTLPEASARLAAHNLLPTFPPSPA
jgi:hypothetical protein